MTSPRGGLATLSTTHAKQAVACPALLHQTPRGGDCTCAALDSACPVWFRLHVCSSVCLSTDRGLHLTLHQVLLGACGGSMRRFVLKSPHGGACTPALSHPLWKVPPVFALCCVGLVWRLAVPLVMVQGPS